MGLSDLFRSPGQVSLKDTMQPLREANARWGDVIIGVILEKQIDGLEGSIWKENVRNLVNRLLEDALEMYGDRWPLRRVRILLRCLEFSYYAGPREHNWNPDDILKQVVGLLRQEVNVCCVSFSVG
jgi:separase